MTAPLLPIHRLARRFSPGGIPSQVSFLLIAAWAGYTLLVGGHWWMQGNIHDLFMVLPAAHFFGSDAGLGSTFHTSFGWIYIALHHAAWSLVQSIPSLDLGAIPLLTGLIFSPIFLLLYALVHRLLRPWMRLPWWGAALLLTLLLTPRHLSLKPPLYMLWYSLYNHHLWACWLLQLLMVLGWQRRMSAIPAPDPCTLRRLGALQAAFLYLGLHYKLSFFLASGGLVLVPCLSMNRRANWPYLAWTAAFLCGGMLLTALAGYDYPRYLADLLPAFHAKQIQNTNKACSLAALLLLGCLLAAEVLVRRQQARALGQSPPWVPTLPRLWFFLLVLGSAWLSSLSNYSQVPLFLFITAGFLLWLEPALATARLWPLRLLRWLLLALGLGAVAMNIAAMADLAYHRTHAPDGVDGPRVAHAFESRTGRYRLPLWLPPESSAQRPDTGQSVAEWVENALRVQRKPPGEPTPFGMNPSYNNRDYARFIEAGLALLRPLPALSEARIGSLEFGNPFPLFAEARYPVENQHWLHPGTTHEWADMAIFTRYYAGSDLMLMPTANSDGVPQNLVNCHFFRWNAAVGHPFRLIGAEPYVLLFASASWRAAHPRPTMEIPAERETAMLARCSGMDIQWLNRHPSIGEPVLRSLP